MPYEATKDQYAAVRGVSNQARDAFPVVISDTEDLPVYAKSLKANAAGTLYILPVEAYKKGILTPVKWVATAGEVIPVSVARVFATNTTLNAAGDIIALTE